MGDQSTSVAGIKKTLTYHYIRTYFRILGSCLKTFGPGLWFFYYLIKVPLKLIYIHTSLFLDKIFFPGYKDVEIRKPVFIIGHPRSATTFLHELLTPTLEFMIFKDWEMNHPSLILRKLLGKSKALRMFMSLISDLRFSPYRIRNQFQNKNKDAGGKAVHEYKKKLESISQEEELLFLHTLDTQFLALETPLGFTEKGYPELCFNDDQPHQDRSVLFLKECFKRQIYYTGKEQIIAKMNFSLFRLKTLLKHFPDARIIYLVRSPIETTPSHFSLHLRLLDRQFGLDNIPKEGIEQYLKHRYDYNIRFYQYYEDLINNKEIPEDQILEVRYDSLRNDLAGVVEEIKRFTNLQFSNELDKRVSEQNEKQASYKRKHKNWGLDEFDLTEDKIKEDFDFVFKRYDFV